MASSACSDWVIPLLSPHFYVCPLSGTTQLPPHLKIWNSGYPKEPELGYCSISPSRNAIQNDDADQQTDGSTSRDMGDQGCVLIEVIE